jgi:hypothetical protein
MQSIFTGYHPACSEGNWFTVRLLTKDDFDISEWYISPPATKESSFHLVRELPVCFGKMMVKHEVLSLLPNMPEQMVKSFLNRDTLAFSEPLTLHINIPNHHKLYVGIRSERQWKKYNEIRDQLIALRDTTGEGLILKTIEKINDEIARFVKRMHDEYLHTAVNHYRTILAYDDKMLDQAAGNLDINQKIKELSDKLNELKQQRRKNREQVLKQYWEFEVDSIQLPKEVKEAIVSSIKHNGFVHSDKLTYSPQINSGDSWDR